MPNNPLTALTGAAGGSPIDIMDILLNNAPGREAPAQTIQRALLTQAATAPPQQVSPVEPEPPKPWQTICLALTDALQTYAAGMNPRMIPGHQLQQLQRRREARAGKATELKQRQSDQQSATDRQRAAIQADQLGQDVARRDKFAEQAVGTQLGLEAEARNVEHDKAMAKVRHDYDMELEGLRQSGRGKAADDTDAMVKDARRLVAQWASSMDELLASGKTVETLRDELDLMLEAEGVYGMGREYVMSFFESRIVAPQKAKSDTEYAAIADAAMQSAKDRAANRPVASAVTETGRTPLGFTPAMFGGGRSR